jgi:hypothetical protein
MRLPVLATTLAFVVAGAAPALAAAPRPGDLVITEIAANPSLAEPAGEFVVVDNAGRSPVVLDGVRLTDAAGAFRGVVAPDTSLDAGQRIALQPASGADAYGCRPAPHRALLTAWAGLNNAGDTVILEAPDGAELDRVGYPREAFAEDGPSRRLDPAFRTPSRNDDFTRWTPSPGAATPCALPGPRFGTLRLSSSLLTASERAPSVTLDVRREGGTNGRVTVPYATVDAGASGGSDYARTSGSAVFAAGQENATLTVPLFDDAQDEPDERFTIVLGAPAGGVALGDPQRATVVLYDDDPPPAPVEPKPTPTLAPAAPPAIVTPLAIPPVRVATPAAQAPPAAARPPRATLAVAAWQPLLRRRGLAVAVGCDRECTLSAGARIELGRGRSLPLISATRSVAAGGPAVLLLKLRARHFGVLRRALRRRGTLRATATARPAGGDLVERRVPVR